MISANAVLPMCLIMALGYGTRRLGWIRREEISAINKIAFRIFLPCLLYYNVYCSDLSGSFDPLLMAYAVGGVLLTFGLSLGYTLLTEKLPERRGVMIQGMFRSNYVIMGIPVATALLGSDQLGTSRIYMEGNVVRRSSENVRQCLRQHVFSRCLFAGQQQIFALQKRGNRHLQNLFSKKRDFRRAHAVL